MAEYIEREALIEFVKQNTPDINGETTIECVERAIRTQTAADVVEVRHEKWNKNGNGRDCLICGFKYYANGGFFNYCPNCGAKMDGREYTNE